jgi:hypothetical protein
MADSLPKVNLSRAKQQLALQKQREADAEKRAEQVIF